MNLMFLSESIRTVFRVEQVPIIVPDIVLGPVPDIVLNECQLYP
jgi:hypothetical protein